MLLHKHWTFALGLSLATLACSGDDDAGDESMETGTTDDADTTGDATTEDATDESGTTNAETTDAETTDADTTDGVDTTDTGAIVEFAAVHQILMDQGCTGGYCHGSGQGGLTMTDAQTAYMNLVGVDATLSVCGLQKRVVPGDPESSIMWRRARPVALDMGDACADKMPMGSMGLPDAEAQVVYDWIAGGALP